VIKVVIVWSSNSTILRIVNVMLAVVCVGVALDGEISIHREEIAVPGGTFAILRGIFLLLAPVILLSHSFVSNRVFALIESRVDHSGVGLEVRSVVPDIENTFVVTVQFGKNVTSDHRGTNCPEEERPAGMSRRLDIGPVINKSLNGVNGHTTRKSLHATANNNSCGPCKGATNHPVEVKVGIVLSLNFFAVFPGNTLRASLELVVVSGQPSVFLDAGFKEIQIINFLLVGRDGRNARFEN